MHPPADNDDDAQAELARLVQGVPQFHVRMSARQVAGALWDYGEDKLVERALTMSHDELADIQGIAAHYENPEYPLPMTGQNITHNHVDAFAAITLFEGQVRPLAQTRRRPRKNRPENLTPQLSDYTGAH